MEGFKSNLKMKSDLSCYKEGGYVTKKQLVAYEKKEDAAEEKKDIEEDKKIVKKAIGQHESAQHKGAEKTEIKLKHGGRSKKEAGTVRKYKTGGVTDAMKTGGVTDAMCKGGMAKKKTGGVVGAMKKGGKPVKKADGGAATAANMPVGLDRAAAMSGRTMPVAGVPAKDRVSIMPVKQTGLDRAATMSGRTFPRAKKGGSTSSKKPQAGTAKAVARKADGGVISNYDSTMMNRAPMAEPIVRPRTAPDNLEQLKGGMGQAASIGPMGGAAPLGVTSDQERQILRGLQALGQYAEGGKV